LPPSGLATSSIRGTPISHLLFSSIAACLDRRGVAPDRRIEVGHGCYEAMTVLDAVLGR